MADSEIVYDEEYASDGTLKSRTPRTRERVLSDSDIRTLRQNCRDIRDNTSLPLWGRALARAVLGLTYEPSAQPAVAQFPRQLDEHGHDVPDVRPFKQAKSEGDGA